MQAGEEIDVLVIGAGQAGLVTGRLLQDRGVSAAIVDRHERIGDSWRQRYDSLTLFSSRAYSSLPGLALAGDPSGYPGKDEIADYLEHYARIMHLPVRTNEAVRSLEQENGAFVVQTDRTRITAGSVIVASGPFQVPFVPNFAAQLAPDVAQFTGANYYRPEQLPTGGRVLVVGDGPTGRQISAELAPTHEVWLAGGKFRVIVPQRFLGRDIIGWFDTTGALRADKESLHGRFVHLFDPIPGWHLRLRALRRLGVKTMRRAIHAEGCRVHFSDGSSENFDAVIWALGYHNDGSWLNIAEAVAGDGRYIEERGVSPVPGLFYIGRDWQNNRASALLAGVGNDAADIANRAIAFVQARKAKARSAIG